jgi:putative CocE/NonD family hydrolase
MTWTISPRWALRLLLVVALAAALLSAAPPPSAQAQQMLPCDFGGAGSYATVSRPAQYDFLPQQVVTIPSELDGVAIQMSIVRPDVPEGTRVPVIVEASVYYHPLQSVDARTCKARLTENFVPQGYAVVLLAVRGSADSGGCMNLMGPKERADIDQAITWLGTQSWSNGAVGMSGLSYNGATQWMAAAFGNPHLKTIVPASGVPDLFDLLFGGGVPDWRGPSTIITNIYYAESAAFYLPGRSVQSTAEVLACPEYVDGNIATGHAGVTGELDPVGYWAQRRYLDQIAENYRGSIFMVQGMQDWNVSPGFQFPWVNELVERSRRDSGPGIRIKYMLGQWGHSHPDGRRADWGDILLDWFDHELKGDTTVDLGAVADVQDSTGLWRTAGSWPPAGTDTTWSLTSDQRLSPQPSDATGTVTVTADPFHVQTANQTLNLPQDVRDLCEWATCAKFTTDDFAEEFRFAGRPQARLTATPHGPGGQLSVHLFSVVEDDVLRLGWGQVDLRFPNGIQPGDPKAQPVSAGAPVELDFGLQPLDAVVPAGGRLVMVVSQGTAHNRFPGMSGAPIDVHVGGDSAALTVTHIQPTADDFFTPGE